MTAMDNSDSQPETGNSKLMDGQEHGAPPPFLKTWKQVYTLVVCELVVLIAAFYALMKSFS